MEIVKYPAKVLETKGKDITAADDEVRARIRQMFELMYEARGVGLAAPQVGWSARVFIANPTADPEQPEHELVMINPEITARSGREIAEEGCLSFPGLLVHVARSTAVTIEFDDMEGQRQSLRTDEPFLARILQHELDHLLGVLFITRMTPADRISVNVQKKLKEFRAAKA